MQVRMITLRCTVLALLALPTNALGQAMIVELHEISSEAARRMVDECVAFGAEAGDALAVAVVDPAGNLLDFHARQGAPGTAILTARLKAETAARWRRSTQELSDRVDNNINRAPQWIGDFPRQGGLPILRDGEIIGAIGVGGAGDDVGCGRAAVQAVFGDTVQTER